MLQKAVDICRANETTYSQFTSDKTNTQSVIHGIRAQLIQSKQVQKSYGCQYGNWHTKQQVCSEQNAENVDKETTLQKYVIQG